MQSDHSRNRKLLVSVFNAQEAREAVLGGARIVDSEDPRSALGNIKPVHIMAVSNAVLNFKRDLEIQLSTNIGEDQLLFDRSETGQAIEKSPYEIAGKAAQAAVGVACAMGTRVHPCNLVKVGVDGMDVDLVREVLQEVVLTLNRTEQFCHSQVMSVLFAQDMDVWNQRKKHKYVREELVGLREFHSCDPEDTDAFDLQDYAVNSLGDNEGNAIFDDQSQVSLDAMIEYKILPEGANHTYVKLNELFSHSQYFPRVSGEATKTARAVIKAMVDVTAEAGANSIMLDTRIQSKVARICLVDTACNGMIDINKFDVREDLARQGILSLENIRYFVDYCHFMGVEANVAGSVQSYQAQQLWVKIPDVDQISTRGAASAVQLESGEETSGADTRRHRVIKRALVLGLAAPEHGGALNLPIAMKSSNEAMNAIKTIHAEISEARQKQGLPELESFFVDKYGNLSPLL